MVPIKYAIKWSVLSALILILTKIVRGIIIPKILDPTEYGLFSSISIYTRYLQFADLGAHAQFIKEIPKIHYYESGAQKQFLLNKTFTLIILSFMPVTLYLSCSALFYNGPHKEFYVPAILILILITLLAKLKDLFISYATGTQDFKSGGLASIMNNLIPLIFVTIGVKNMGAIGGVIGVFVSELTAFLYVRSRIIIDVKFTLSKKTWINMRQNLIQFSLSVSEVLFSTIDQIMVLLIFNVSALGLYALGLTFSWILESISEIYNTSSYPKLTILARDNIDAALELINSTLRCYVLTCLAVLPFSMYIVACLVSYYFTSYLDGLDVYFYIIFLGLSRGMWSLLRRSYIALSREKIYIFSVCIINIFYLLSLVLCYLYNIAFKECVILIVLANFCSIVLLYYNIYANKSKDFLVNLILVAVCLSSVSGYQNIVTITVFNPFEINAGNTYLFLVSCISALLVFFNRSMFLGYLR